MARGRKPEGAYYHPSYRRIMEHKGHSLSIYWSPSMLDYLRKHYATSLNEELAGYFGVSISALIRKAKQQGLSKDPSWLYGVHLERTRMARSALKRWYCRNPEKAKEKALKAWETRRARLNML